MKFLLVGLGNKGLEYKYTRHNIGFLVLDMLANKHGVEWKSGRLADVTEFRIKNKVVTAIKPTTYMNLSGNAYKYWLDHLNIPLDNSMAIVDDLDLDLGQLRIKKNGSSGGHNGLKNIEAVFNTNKFPRLRFGIGRNFVRGQQVDYVLSNWTDEEAQVLPEMIARAVDAAEACILSGYNLAMNKFNTK